MTDSPRNIRQIREAKEREKRVLFDLAEELAHSSDRKEQKRLKAELARMTFGDMNPR